MFADQSVKNGDDLLHDLRAGALDVQTVLYWNTLNSRDLSAETESVDVRGLTPPFRSYFES